MGKRNRFKTEKQVKAVSTFSCNKLACLRATDLVDDVSSRTDCRPEDMLHEFYFIIFSFFFFFFFLGGGGGFYLYVDDGVSLTNLT